MAKGAPDGFLGMPERSGRAYKTEAFVRGRGVEFAWHGLPRIKKR